MANVEANASVEALSNNELNFGLANLGDISLNFSGKGIANAIGALAVVMNPNKLAEMRESNAAGIVRAAERYRESLGVSMEQSVVMALGTSATPEQASNVVEVFGQAGRLLFERGVDPQPPIGAKLAKMLESAKNAEDWARDKWAELIAGELESPGAFSKRSMAILDEMGRDDALLFEKLCSLCTGGYCEYAQRSFEAVPYLDEEESGEGPSLTGEEKMRLTALGLLNTEYFCSTYVAGGSMRLLMLHGECYFISAGEKGRELMRAHGVLSPFGQELAALCGLGTHPDFVEMVCTDIERQGFTLYPSEEIMRARGFETFAEARDALGIAID